MSYQDEEVFALRRGEARERCLAADVAHGAKYASATTEVDRLKKLVADRQRFGLPVPVELRWELSHAKFRQSMFAPLPEVAL